MGSTVHKLCRVWGITEEMGHDMLQMLSCWFTNCHRKQQCQGNTKEFLPYLAPDFQGLFLSWSHPVWHPFGLMMDFFALQMPGVFKLAHLQFSSLVFLSKYHDLNPPVFVGFLLAVVSLCDILWEIFCDTKSKSVSATFLAEDGALPAATHFLDFHATEEHHSCVADLAPLERLDTMSTSPLVPSSRNSVVMKGCVLLLSVTMGSSAKHHLQHDCKAFSNDKCVHAEVAAFDGFWPLQMWSFHPKARHQHFQTGKRAKTIHPLGEATDFEHRKCVIVCDMLLFGRNKQTGTKTEKKGETPLSLCWSQLLVNCCKEEQMVVGAGWCNVLCKNCNLVTNLLFCGHNMQFISHCSCATTAPTTKTTPMQTVMNGPTTL